MDNATGLYCASVSTPDTTLHQAAAAAKSMHLALLLYAEFPTEPMNAYGALPCARISVPDTWSETLHAAQSESRERIQEIEAPFADVGVSANLRPLFVANADIKPGVMHSTRISDIVYFAPDLRNNAPVFKEMLNTVLFNSPVPAWVNGTLADSPQTVHLAWNSSLACARGPSRLANSQTRGRCAYPVLRCADRC